MVRTRAARALFVAAGLCAAAIAGGPQRAHATGTTELIAATSTTWYGGGYNAFPSNEAADVAFTSDAALVGQDANGAPDAYVFDRQAEQVELVSSTTTGAAADGSSDAVAVSGDGHAILFESTADDLAPGTGGGFGHVYLRDRLLGTTELIDVATDGSPSAIGASEGGMSGDGRFVVFSSASPGLVAGDDDAQEDVFVRDRVTQATTRISRARGGREATGPSFAPAISADGRYIAFSSRASNLVRNDTNGIQDVFLYDRTTGKTKRVNVSTTGRQALGGRSDAVAVSDSGVVVFTSRATNLVGRQSQLFTEVYARDTAAGTTELISESRTGRSVAPARAYAEPDAISADGRYVVFYSKAGNVVPGLDTLQQNVFLRDREAHTTTLVSVNFDGGEGSSTSYGGSIDAAGTAVAFTSQAPDLVAGDTDGVTDAFVRLLSAAIP